jgi:hypothetical protein
VGPNPYSEFDEKMTKTSGGKKIDMREMNFRYFERRFFCHFIFLPFSWLRPKAALAVSWLSLRRAASDEISTKHTKSRSSNSTSWRRARMKSLP